MNMILPTLYLFNDDVEYKYRSAGASFEGAGGRPPKEKEKRKKKEKERKKRKKERRKKGTMNNVKLLHIKTVFLIFQ